MDDVSISPESFPGYFKPIKYGSLPWEEKATLMWSWFWRTMLIAIVVIQVAFKIASLVYDAVTLTRGELGDTVVSAFALIVGSVIGYMGTHPLIKYLTKDKMGEYKIVILKKQPSDS